MSGQVNNPGADQPGKKPPYYEAFANQIIEQIKEGTAPWQKPWAAGELIAPYNPSSGTVYKGINNLMLSAADYADPRFMTLLQANQEDLRVKKGEKAKPIAFWQWQKKQDALGQDGKPLIIDGKKIQETIELDRPVIKISNVFHVSQLQTLDGQDLPPPGQDSIPRPAWDPEEKAEALLQASGVAIKHDQRDRAFYRLSHDEIHLPPRASFDSPGNYYSTVLHELSHSTRHPSRLDRENGPFGTPEYAKEELRAEIASWMLSQELGTAHNPQQNTAYVASWVKALEDDPYEIVRACRDAEKIKEYVMGLDMKKELGREQAREQEPLFVVEMEHGGKPHMWRAASLEDFYEATERKLNLSASELYSQTTPNQLYLDEYVEFLGSTSLPDEAALERAAMTLPEFMGEQGFPEGFDPDRPIYKAAYQAHIAGIPKPESGYLLEDPGRLEACRAAYFSDMTGFVAEGKEAALARLEQVKEFDQFKQHPEVYEALRKEFSTEPNLAAEKVYLDVPFQEKEQAKAVGAKWDFEAKAWYAPEGADLSKLEAWLPAPDREVAAEPQKGREALIVENADIRHLAAIEAVRALEREFGSEPGAWRAGPAWPEQTHRLVDALENHVLLLRNPETFNQLDPYEKYLEFETGLRQANKEFDLAPQDIDPHRQHALQEMSAMYKYSAEQYLIHEKAVILEDKLEEDLTRIGLPLSEFTLPEVISPQGIRISGVVDHEAVLERLLAEKVAQEKKLVSPEKEAEKQKRQSQVQEKVKSRQQAGPASVLRPEQEFAEALAKMGLDLQGNEPTMDGNMHRVPVFGGKPGKLDGAYVGHLDEYPAGFMQNFKVGEVANWKYSGHVLTTEYKQELSAEVIQRKEEQAKEREAERERSEKRAYAKFANATPAVLLEEKHPYLEKKGIEACGVATDGKGNLLISGQNVDGRIQTVQTISADGDKMFEKGCRKTGAFFIMNARERLFSHDKALPEEKRPLLIAEGFATAASIHMATNYPVIVAFDSSNLKHVAEAVHARRPEAPILICGDNDHSREKNVGLQAAMEASQAVNGRFVVPNFTNEEKAKGLTDFNDLHGSRGLETVAKQVGPELKKALEKSRGKEHDAGLGLSHAMGV